MKRSKTVTVGELLDEFFQRPYVAAKVAEGRLRDTWREIVGPAADAETTELRLENHILHVRIRSSILRNELFYQREALGAEINRRSKNPDWSMRSSSGEIHLFSSWRLYNSRQILALFKEKMYFCTLEAKIQTKTAYFYDKAKTSRKNSAQRWDENRDVFRENSKSMIIALLALFVLAAAIFGYRQLISQPRERKAAEMIAQAQYRFESTTPEYQLALEGDANGPGFLDVIDQYGSTRAGNLAKHYAGICYLRLGDLDNAAAYLAKYKPAKGIPAEIVNAQNIGLQGDIAVEKGDYAAAIKLFEKAAKVSDNNLTAPMYLRKAALAANAMGNKEQALGFAQRIQNEFPASAEAQNAEKLMGTIQQ